MNRATVIRFNLLISWQAYDARCLFAQSIFYTQNHLFTNVYLFMCSDPIACYWFASADASNIIMAAGTVGKSLFCMLSAQRRDDDSVVINRPYHSIGAGSSTYMSA